MIIQSEKEKGEKIGGEMKLTLGVMKSFFFSFIYMYVLHSQQHTLASLTSTCIVDADHMLMMVSQFDFVRFGSLSQSDELVSFSFFCFAPPTGERGLEINC